MREVGHNYRDKDEENKDRKRGQTVPTRGEGQGTEVQGDKKLM